MTARHICVPNTNLPHHGAQKGDKKKKKEKKRQEDQGHARNNTDSGLLHPRVQGESTHVLVQRANSGGLHDSIVASGSNEITNLLMEGDNAGIPAPRGFFSDAQTRIVTSFVCQLLPVLR